MELHQGCVAVTVHFVGAGPGAADLITLRGRDLLAAADVCLYAGSLISPEVLDHCAAECVLIDTAELTLDEIIQALVSADQAGRDIARLCSGDPSLFSAVAEQMRRLDQLGVQYDVCPGVPAFSAAAARLGRELTVPAVAQTVILTRTADRSTPMPPGQDLAALGASGATLVIHLSVQRIDAVVAELLPVYPADTPVAVLAWVSHPHEKVVCGTLATIAGQVREAGVSRAAVIMVGPALAAGGFPDSHLYSAGRCRTVIGQ
jgi:precorrin-4/cobalt-precorrin-4 C11-methyltransferase